ncbi:uncharacterized protein LOC142332013 isoform X2 [Lycorma delicatula]|uniref:uncharacterized protein LOC142332013 isoform X2 n=1 Tax=Lycorma delicatula TaxID=130591 RepID=UPI003F51A067
MKSTYIITVLLFFMTSYVLSQPKDPYFPGNPGWNEQFKKSMNFMQDPNFPGNRQWNHYLKRDTSLPRNCNVTDDVDGLEYPSQSETIIINNDSERDTNLSDVPVTRTTYVCNDSLFYEEPFLMLKTQSNINTDYQNTTYTAYILYNMNGYKFKTGNLVTVVRNGETTSK